jgi:hypothetical protein
MLIAEMQRTTAKPNITFPRNLSVGIIADTGFCRTAFNQPTCGLHSPKMIVSGGP